MSKIAFIFPGQGAQKAGMGKDFYENSKTAAEVIDRASELLGLDMKALCFEENDLLDQTEYTQAALVTVCMAMEKVLRERGLAPDVTAGLSLGEYCAIASAGGMSTENAITTVRKRGILMQNAVPGGQGAMAAVLGLDAGKIEEVLADRSGVMIANYNCPGQIVITGWKEDVEQAADALKEAGAEDVKLFAKIENLDGVRKLEELLPGADEIVIARGDLGNAVHLWDLPSVQREISQKCQATGKPFMVVTQMLASMERNPVPTRAEVNDIFHAVLDGASSVMVTGETAAGDYPVEVIRYLVNTVRSAELVRHG